MQVHVGILGVTACVTLLVALLVVLPSMRSESRPNPPASAGQAGGAKDHCIDLPFADGVLDKSEITAASRLTGVKYGCLSTFANPSPQWSDWDNPWMFSNASDGWDAWLAAGPDHQVILGMDLIPESASDNSNPLAWEQPCASGEYDQYATKLAKNLVSHGAGNVVIRLGVEANGSWEYDYVGTTNAEMSSWATCYDKEVAAMRAVPGANFQFVWNPNSCTANLPISKWYPGNSYVDIIGVDAYDKDCETLKTVSQEGWAAYSTDSASEGAGNPDFPSLANVEAFAVANGKPMSFPEWGLTGSGDDASYVSEIARAFDNGDFAFESYFDINGKDVTALSAKVPNATAAYAQAFKLSLQAQGRLSGLG
jgi:Glycosyl hydrolase family 26